MGEWLTDLRRYKVFALPGSVWERSERVSRCVANAPINYGLHVHCKGLREQAKEMEPSEVSHLPHQKYEQDERMDVCAEHWSPNSRKDALENVCRL